jgi:predicted Fe-Mo cluster-binding NifX family protein
MIIAVSAAGTDVTAQVDPSFGRCGYFLFFDSETGKAEAQANEAGQAGGGAGVQAAQLVAGKGAGVLLTGNVGPNAHQALSAAEIAVYTGLSGSVKEAIDAYLGGRLEAAQGPTVSSHHGMGPRRETP